jgi:transcriptional regulator with XRE-family HTH domain
MQTQTLGPDPRRLPKHGPEFSIRLAAALEQLNMSRVALARELAVDKAVVSRWLAGENRSTEHNLTRLTELVRRFRPRFSLAGWRGPDECFQRALESRPLPATTNLAPGRLMLQGCRRRPCRAAGSPISGPGSASTVRC